MVRVKIKVAKDTETPVVLTFAEKLWLLRRRNDLTRDTLAKMMGVTARTVRSWEENTRKPTLIETLTHQKFLDRSLRSGV